MRLPEYDYSQPGWYFVTICTKNRREVLGAVEKGEMRVNQLGKIVMDAWQDLPNHVHGIINIPDRTNVPHPTVAAGLRPAATVGFVSTRCEENGVLHASLIEIIRALKSFSARRINELQKTQGRPVWQRSFHEHILRGNNDILLVREYIRLNPIKWDQDRNNVKNHKS